MPTRLSRNSPGLRGALLAVAGGLMLSPSAAHDVAVEPVPDVAGWRIGAGVAVTAIGANDPIPSATLPGVLDTGQNAPDRRGLGLEHAAIGAGLRLNDMFGANLAVGWHVGEAAHLEAAWVQARWASDAALLTLGAGRAKVPMGSVLTSAGDFGRFSLVPLVKRGSLNEDWYDEGATLSWRGAAEALLRRVDVGAWRGTGFPGGGDLPVVPSLHVQLAHGEVEMDGFFAYLQPTGRGTYARGSTSPGHTHGVPTCEVSLSGLVCFDGRVNVLGGSLSWASHEWPVTVVAAALWRDEQGSLYSQNGNATYHGKTLGGWVDAVWDWREDWQLAARFEALSATQNLSGPGAALVAAEAGLLPNWPAQRLTAALAYSPDPAWRLSAEIGNERTGGSDNPFLMLRVVWTAPWLLSGQW
jgi:hypothetical protein